ncbi:MAG: PEGA domain-containing protein, partial [Deltaproteobacteria bacterium]|nr:PEGA domain-containing protein [Deltaproteobacteria bacterium]
MTTKIFAFNVIALLMLAFSAGKTYAEEDPLVEEARAISRLGMDHFKKGEFERAFDKFLTAYKKVEHLDRKDVQAALIMNLGLSLWKMNRLVEGREYFVKYLEISPNEEKKEVVRGYIKEIGAELSKTHTFISINTEPDGAEIVIHEAFGTRKVQAPFMSYLPFGVYSILIKKEGFVDRMEKVVAEKEKPVKLKVALDKVPQQGELVFIKSTEEGAEVILNGQKIGLTPVKEQKLIEGKYSLEVMKDGFEPFKTDVVVTAGKPVTVNVELRLKPKEGVGTGGVVVTKGEEKKPKEKPVAAKKEELKISEGVSAVEEKTYYPPLYGWIGVGAGAAMLGAGVAMTISALGYRDKINSLNKTVWDDGVQTEAEKSQYNSYKSKLESRATFSYIFYGLGFAAAAGGAAYLLFLPHEKSDV